MNEQTVKCNICGQPYKVYMFYAGDQSACPSCRIKAEQNMKVVVYPVRDIKGGELDAMLAEREKGEGK